MTPLPIVFILDDPPINTSYWLRRQPEEMGILRHPRGDFGQFVSRWRDQEPSKIIPNAFWKKFAGWAAAAGIRGKFSLLPCPAGLGFLDDKVEGYSPDQLAELLTIVRNQIMPRFDITPEILTHSMAWDWANHCLLPITEHEWMAQQSEDTLADYMTKALQVLDRAGIQAAGITQPCNFAGDENLYARAVLRAMQTSRNLNRTFYFLHCDGDSPQVISPIKIARPDTGEYVVSIVSAIRPDEPFWQSLYGDGDIHEMADYFLSADGARGRFIDLLQTNSPLIFHAHGQTLFSNGSEKGFQSLQLVIDRVTKFLANRVQWMKTQEFADWRIAAAIPP